MLYRGFTIISLFLLGSGFLGASVMNETYRHSAYKHLHISPSSHIVLKHNKPSPASHPQQTQER